MKKIFLLILLFLSVIIIYVFANKKQKLVFSIGIENGDINYVPTDYRITDIIIDIENNININGYDIQNLLVRSTIIYIDLNEYFYLRDYQAILEQIEDLETLFKLMRKYTKEKIYILLLDEVDILSEYTNKKIILLSKKYDIMVVR